MNFVNLIALLAASTAILAPGCAPQDKGIAGKWVSQTFMDYESGPEGVTSFTLDFKDDGSFTGRHVTRVMMVRDSKISGKYEQKGDTLSLKGSAETYMDDGYAKDTWTEPFAMELRAEADRLTVLPIDPTLIVVFRREGTPPLKPPTKPADKSSDKAALQFLAQVEKKYAGMKTYSDNGVFKSGGKGFQPEDCRFRIRFSRDGRFLFKIDSYEAGKVYQTDAAWATAEKSWVYSGSVGGAGEERPIGNGLSILRMDFSTLIPSLLMTKRMGYSDLADRKSVVFLPDERVEGVLCKVIELDSGTKHASRIWVDSKSFLIRKAHGSFLETTATFRPKVDVEIPEAEFRFAPPG